MRKSHLHTAYTMDDDGYWRSLPPHIPGACYGAQGAPCPTRPWKPCEHKHTTAHGANRCSQNRDPFEPDNLTVSEPHATV